jgi:hypothetical protein
MRIERSVFAMKILKIQGGILLAVLLVGTGCSIGADTVDPLSGIYKCKGKNYDGTTIIKKSGDAYQMIWSIGSQTHRGVALRSGEWLSSSWLPDDTRAVPGIVVYRIEKNGVLKGTFTSYPGGRVEEEILTYQAAVN